MKYCENCGQELPEKAKFCGKCGYKQDVFVVTIADDEQELTIKNEISDKLIMVDDSYYENEFSAVVQSDENDIEKIRCPYCLEVIIKGARICRFCRTDLTNNSIQSTGQATVEGRKFNWAIPLCAASLAMQVVIIILALTDLLVLSIEMGYSGYTLYEYSFGLSIFSCFDISGFIESIQRLTSSFSGQNLSIGLKGFGVVLIILVVWYAILFVWRLTELYKDYKWCWKNKKRFVFDGYSVALSVVFAVLVIVSCIYVGMYLSNAGISAVKIGLSPSMIVIIVLLCMQIAVNVIANIYDDAIWEIEKKRSAEKTFGDKWICAKCGLRNKTELSKCMYCGTKRMNSKNKKWLCSTCFKSNSLNVDKCEYCGALKPSLHSRTTKDKE